MREYWTRFFTRDMTRLEKSIEQRIESDTCVAANLAMEIDRKDRSLVCMAALLLCSVVLCVFLIFADGQHKAAQPNANRNPYYGDETMKEVRTGSIVLIAGSALLVGIFAYWMMFDDVRDVTRRLEQEVSTDRDDTVAGNFLLLRAEAWWDKGMYEEAKRDWDKAREVIPSHVDMNATEPKALGWPPAGPLDAKRVHTYPYYDEAEVGEYDLRKPVVPEGIFAR